MPLTWSAIGIAAAKAAVQPALEVLKPQLARRNSLGVAGQVSMPADPQITSAIELLSEQPDSLAKLISSKAQKAISDIPDVFEDKDVRLWLQKNDVRELIAQGTRAALAGQDAVESRDQAGTNFASEFENEAWWGEFIFDAAVAFVTLTLRGHLTAGENVLLDSLAYQNAQNAAELAKIRTEEIAQPADAVRLLIEPVVERAEALRTLQDDNRIKDLVKLATRVSEGDLVAAENDLKISLFRCVAAALARLKQVDEAEEWIDKAHKLGANDLITDRARLALMRDDLSEVFKLLSDQRDSTSILILASAIHQRDDVRSACEFVRKSLSPDDMNGWLLATQANWLAEGGEWDAAHELLRNATDEQTSENPVLFYNRMRLRLALMVSPERDRFELLKSDSGLPLPAKLRTDAEGQELRESALADLATFRDLVPEYGPDHGHWFEAQKLFLELSDETRAPPDGAVEKLNSYCLQPETAVLFSWLASSLSIQFDDSVAQRELARKEALDGLTGFELQAALGLTLRKGSAEDILRFLDNNEAKLETSGMSHQFVVGLRIEALAHSGACEQARALLEQARDELEDAVALSLEAIIVEIEGGETSVEEWQAAYSSSGRASDLAKLVEAMSAVNHSSLGDYAVKLWEANRRVDDAVKCANALFNAQRDTELDDLLEAIGDEGDHDEGILRHRAWASFRAGRLDDALCRTRAQRENAPDDTGLRQLEINILLEGGLWADLGALAQRDLDRRESRTAHQLLQAAGLAHINADPIAEDLARAAVEQAPDDPEILVGAFNAAIQQGTDWGSEAGQWLQDAVRLSDDDGPIQSAPISKFLEMSKAHDEQNSKLNKLIMRGELPLEMASQPLGVTLSELLLTRLEKNVDERDARLKLFLPIVAGNRLKTDLSKYETLAFDLSSILVLETVGLLDEVIEHFPAICLAAGTMPHLFFDFIRAQRGQKSRYLQAESINALLVSKKIRQEPLAENVDDEDAEIDLVRSLGGQYVHTFPIYERGSLAQKARDVSDCGVDIVSPAAVIQALENAGELDTRKSEIALGLLGESREAWPDEPEVNLSKPLLLHVVSLNALHNAGIVDMLITAGVDLVVSSDALRSIEHELASWQQAQEPLRAIERVRDKLVAAAKAGKAIHAGFRRRGVDEEEERQSEQSQLVSLMTDASDYDVLVSAERAINKVGKLTDRNGLDRPIATIIDVIEHLSTTEAIDSSRRDEVRQRLRECGVAFIPLEVDELVSAANRGDWKSGPPRAFRAIIESIHLPLQRGALVMPDEMYWIANVLAKVTKSITRIWAELPVESAEAAATWLVKCLPDFSVIIGSNEAVEVTEWASTASTTIYFALAQPVELPPERVEQYHEWFSANVMPRLGGRDRRLKENVIKAISLAVESTEAVEIADDERIERDEVCRWLLRRIPRAISDEVLKQPEVRNVLGLKDGGLTVAGQDVDPEILVQFLSNTIAGTKVPLLDDGGKVVVEHGEWDPDIGVCAKRDSSTVIFEFAGLLHDDSNVRLATFDRLMAETTMPTVLIADWHKTLKDHQITTGELVRFHDERAASPERWLERFESKLGDLTLNDLQSDDEAYYASFISLGSLNSLSQVLKDDFAARQPHATLAQTAFMLGPLAVMPDTDFADLTSKLPDEGALALASELSTAGDPYSAVAALQIVSARISSEGFEKIGTEILQTYCVDQQKLSEIAMDYSALAIAVIGMADISGLLVSEGIAKRRCALLAHAGLLAREFAALEVERPQFLEMVRRWVGDTVRLAGLVERSKERWWIRDRLEPVVIAAQVRGRIKAIAKSLGNESTPSDWKQILADTEPTLPDPLEHSAGPLDEYSSGWSDQIFDSGLLEEALASEDIEKANAALFNRLMVFEIPSDAELARRLVIQLVERSDNTKVEWSIMLGLVASMRWRDVDLAEKILNFAAENDLSEQWSLRAFVELALAASASSDSTNEGQEIFEKHLRKLVDRRLKPNDAHELVGVLDKLQDLIPGMESLAELRTSALLAA